MKASKVIADVDRLMDNSIEPTDKIRWINEVEVNIFSGVVIEPYESKVNLVANQELYDITFRVEDILSLKVEGRDYTIGSILLPQPNTYYKKNGKLGINPIPTRNVENGIIVMYRWKPQPITQDTLNSELYLPEQFEAAYEYYLRSQIAFEQKNAGESNAWASRYNAVIRDFNKWYLENQPNLGALKTSARWRG